MEHKERIAQYLSGIADIKAQRQTENALLYDADFLESFIGTVEQHLYTAPSSLAGAVMRLLPADPGAAITVPVLSRRMSAAVCFCSAAAILLVTMSGVDRSIIDFILSFDHNIVEFITSQSGKFSDWITFVKALN